MKNTHLMKLVILILVQGCASHIEGDSRGPASAPKSTRKLPEISKYIYTKVVDTDQRAKKMAAFEKEFRDFNADKIWSLYQYSMDLELVSQAGVADNSQEAIDITLRYIRKMYNVPLGALVVHLDAREYVSNWKYRDLKDRAMVKKASLQIADAALERAIKVHSAELYQRQSIEDVTKLRVLIGQENDNFREQIGKMRAPKRNSRLPASTTQKIRDLEGNIRLNNKVISQLNDCLPVLPESAITNKHKR